MKAELDTKTLIQDSNITLHITIHRLNQWLWRLWLGKQLLILAAWVMWMNIEIEER